MGNNQIQGAPERSTSLKVKYTVHQKN